MPNCYKLLDKETGEAIILAELDDNICREVFNVEPDKENWIHRWEPYLGICYATGKTTEEVVEMFEDELKRIAQYIAERFDATCWYQHK